MGVLALGSMAGPAIGALGGATSPELAFSLIAVAAAVATVAAILAPTGREEPGHARDPTPTWRDRSATRGGRRLAVGILDATCAAVVEPARRRCAWARRLVAAGASRVPILLGVGGRHGRSRPIAGRRQRSGRPGARGARARHRHVLLMR